MSVKGVWRLDSIPHELIPPVLIPQKEVKYRLPPPGPGCDVIRMFSCVPFTRQLHKASLERGPSRMLAAPFSGRPTEVSRTRVSS